MSLYGRLAARLAHWHAIGADAATLRRLRDGVPVEFRGDSPPPSFCLPPLPVSEQQRDWWFNVEEPRLIQLGAITRRSSTAPPPVYCSNAFCVPKDSKSWRLVVNLKRLNSFCKAYNCRYDTLKLLSTWAMKDSWMLKVDLQDAYYHVSVQPDHRHYFTFQFCGAMYEMCTLPFGWINSPYFFVKTMRCVVRYLRDPDPALKRRHRSPPPPPPHQFYPSVRRYRYGVRVLPYLDDFLFVFSSREQALAGSVWVRDVLDFLGLSHHPRKCIWEPSQRLQHLGLVVDTELGTFEVPSDKLKKLKRMAIDLRVTAKKNRRLVLKSDLAKFCGFAQSVKLAIPPAQLFLRELYDDIAQPVSWSSRVRLSRASMRNLDWWANVPTVHSSSPIQMQPVSATLSVDASSHSWGAVLQNMVARSYWRADETDLHINVKELRAVRYALLSFSSFLSNKVVLLNEDNTTTQAVITKFSSRSPELHKEFRLLWDTMCSLGVVLQVRRVASEDNEADAPSRYVDRSDYKLNAAWFDYLEALYGPHEVDLFASNVNAQLPRFYSLHHCPNTAGVDSFAQDWASYNCYANPPYDPDVLLTVVQRVRLERVNITLVVPCWGAQAWWQQLMEVASDVLYLPRQLGLFSPGPGGSVRLLPPPSWQVAVVRVVW